MIRLIWAFAALIGGVGVLAYLIAWLVIPDDDGRYTLVPLAILGALIVLPLVLAVSLLLPLTVTTTP